MTGDSIHPALTLTPLSHPAVLTKLGRQGVLRFSVFELNGHRLIVDNSSLQLLNGATIDYHEELIGAGFRVVSNPNAAKSCGCGASFDLKQ
jgi:iron-sulfur cluster assembly accessory protein